MLGVDSEQSAVLGLILFVGIIALCVFLIVKVVEAANDISAMRQTVEDWYDAYLDIESADEEDTELEGQPGALPEPPAPIGPWSAQMASASADKACPNCAERVNADARICRFCGHGFDTDSVSV